MSCPFRQIHQSLNRVWQHASLPYPLIHLQIVNSFLGNDPINPKLDSAGKGKLGLRLLHAEIYPCIALICLLYLLIYIK